MLSLPAKGGEKLDQADGVGHVVGLVLEAAPGGVRGVIEPLLLVSRRGMVGGVGSPVNFRRDPLDEQQFGNILHRAFRAIVRRTQPAVVFVFRRRRHGIHCRDRWD